MNPEYKIIAEVIEITKKQFKGTRSVESILKKAGIGREAFEQLTENWAGLSADRFFESISPTHNLERISQKKQPVLFEYEKQTFGPPFSDFAELIPITDEEYGDRGSNLEINYEFYDSPFERVIAASVSKGICYLAFEEDEEKAIRGLRSRFPNSILRNSRDEHQSAALSLVEFKNPKPVKLNMRGTDFQLKVWQKLICIEQGRLVSYHQLAKELDMPAASRAVGTAIGRNPVACIMPCHRIIQSDGNFGGYMWGNTLKMAITARETGQIEKLNRH